MNYVTVGENVHVLMHEPRTEIKTKSYDKVLKIFPQSVVKIKIETYPPVGE